MEKSEVPGRVWDEGGLSFRSNLGGPGSSAGTTGVWLGGPGSALRLAGTTVSLGGRADGGWTPVRRESGAGATERG